MSLTIKEKELVCIGAAVATGCKPCTDYHFKKVREAGASDEEIKLAISDALSVRDSAKEIMENHGLKHLGIDKEGAHDAMKDVYDTAELVIRFMRITRKFSAQVKFKNAFKK